MDDVAKPASEDPSYRYSGYRGAPNITLVNTHTKCNRCADLRATILKVSEPWTLRTYNIYTSSAISTLLPLLERPVKNRPPVIFSATLMLLQLDSV